MGSVRQGLQELREEFASLPDGFARYSYLAELSALLSPGEHLHREEYRYRGCQSQVWLRVWQEGDLCRLNMDSDTLIVRGVLVLFRDLLDGQPTGEVLSASFDLLAELQLQEHFSSVRTAGVSGLLPEIQRKLREQT